MSADNYFLILEEEVGRFVVSMGFMSNENMPEPKKEDPRFFSLKEAILYAQSEYTEYGYRILFKDKT